MPSSPSNGVKSMRWWIMTWFTLNSRFEKIRIGRYEMHVLGSWATVDTDTFRFDAVRDVCVCDSIRVAVHMCVCQLLSTRSASMTEWNNKHEEHMWRTDNNIMCALRREWKYVWVWVSVYLCMWIFIQHLYSIPAQAARIFAAYVSLKTLCIEIVLLRRGRAAVRTHWAVLIRFTNDK